jgi:MFS transporter, SP family, arabinose:H+ symporter
MKLGYLKARRRLLLAAAVCSLGGVTFGYDLGAFSAITQTLKEQFGLSSVSFGLTVSFSLWGTIAGSMLAGRLVDDVGRRNLIAGCSLLYVIAALCQTLPSGANWNLLLTLRFLSGTAIGGFTVACPLYLAEIAPIDLRGRFVSLFQLQVGVGVVLGFSTGWLSAHLIPESAYWRWCLAACAIPAIFLLSSLRFMPEEPSRLDANDERRKARAIIRVGVSLCESNWQRTALNGEANSRSRSERLFSRKYTRPILLATSIAVFNQLSGVNILLLYLLEVLSSAGFDHLAEHAFTVVTSSLALVTTLLGMAYVDRLGRKPLLVIGSIGMSMCLFGLAITIPHHLKPLWYLAVLVIYNACFAFSQGTVVWVYLSELFPVSVRGVGQGYGAVVHWIANAVLIAIFPVIEHGSRVGFFYFLAAMMIVQIAVVLVCYPETKGTTVGAITLKPS